MTRMQFKNTECNPPMSASMLFLSAALKSVLSKFSWAGNMSLLETEFWKRKW